MTMNLETFRKLVIPLAAVLLLIIVSVVAFVIFVVQRGSTLPIIPTASLNIEENAEVRSDPAQYLNLTQSTKLPSKLAVYEDKAETKIIGKSTAGKTAKIFGFTKSPKKSGELYIWNENGGTFIASLQDKFTSLDKGTFSEKLVKISKFPGRVKADVITRDTLEKVGINETNVDFDKVSISYSSELGVGGSSGGDKAKVMILDYPLKRNNLAIYDSVSQPLNFKIKINSKGALVGFKAPWYPFAWNIIETYSLKNVQDAINDIEEGEGVVTNLAINGTVADSKEKRTLSNVNIIDVKLGYYSVAGKPNILMPVYLFSGRALLQTSESANVKFYVVAVKDKYFLGK